MAISSAFELETELIISYDLGYINKNEINRIIEEIQEIERMIQGFKKQLITD